MISTDILYLLDTYMYGCHDVGVFARDRIRKPGLPCAFVFNIDLHNKKGQHWVAVYIDKKSVGYYCDSYGLPPSHPEFINFLKKYCNISVYNDVRVQDDGYKACGQLCIFFLLHMSYGWDMDDIIDSLKYKNDSQVVHFVEKL